MNYFTRERYLAMQNFQDDAMDAADADWDAAVAAYEGLLHATRPDMPESVRQLVDGFSLNDARVLSIGQRGDSFIISLQLETPPYDLLTITYSLAGTPAVSQEAFPWINDSTVADWLYDEVQLVPDGTQKHFVHSILLSNGWEINVPFREVQTMTASPLLPHPTRGRPPLPAVQSA